MKKICLSGYQLQSKSWQLFDQRVLWMKISITFLVFSVWGIQLLVANPGYGQGLEDETVTIEAFGEYLPKVLKEIERQTEYRFAYNAGQIEKYQVDLARGNRSLQTTLDLILAGKPLQYKVIREKFIVLNEIPKRPAERVVPRISKENLSRKVLTVPPLNVEGQITDNNGDPLIGVNVQVKGSTKGTASDLNGHYILNDVNENAVLVFSYIGYQLQEVPVQGRSTINVVMLDDVELLEEVVVVGYGIQKKTTVTGSISTMQADEIAEVPVPNISQAIAGKLAGVSMRPNGGQPGYDDPDLHIRGIVTTGNNRPLVVVDGVKRDNIRQIDPSSIESITILKDAAAVAPYGIGGANGVILITTKKGVSGKPSVRYNGSYGFQNPTYLPDMLNAQDYMALQNEAFFNLNPNATTPPNNPETVNNYMQLNREDPWKYPNSNFLDLFNTNVPVQNHNLEFSGGGDNVNYYAGVGYFDQKGIFDPVGYRRFNYNMNLNIDATSTTKVSLALHGSLERTNDIDADESTSGHLFRSFYKFIPTQSLLYPEGDKWGESSANTPVGVLRSDGYQKIDDNTLLASASVEQQLPFIEGLSIKGVFSFDPTSQNRKGWHVPFIYHKIDLNTQPYTYEEAISLQEGQGAPFTWLEVQNNRWTNYTYQGYMQYGNTFGNHSFTGLLVAEARNSTSDWFRTRRNNFAVSIDEISLGSSDKNDYDNDGSSETGSELGFVYRFGYNFKDKYILEASGRYDGHYYFAPGKRWGYFPAFSAAWRLSEEAFLSHLTDLDDLKLRASWGKAGMLAGSAFQYLSGYDLRGNAYAFGNGTLVQGSNIPREANPNITWEISTKIDIGVDVSLWNGLLNMEVDYFHEDRSNMLLAPQVTLPEEYGLSLSEENKGKMKNNGFELNIGTRKSISPDFEYSISGNMSYAKNSMIEVFQTDAERMNPNRTLVGRPYGTPFGYKSLGLFTTSDDKNGDGIINGEDGYNIVQFGELHPGDIRYADLSGPDGVPDGKIDANDLTVIGYPVYPAWTFGLTPSLYYKGIDLTLFFQGSANSSINIRQFMTVPFENNGSNTAYEYMDNRWTPDNQSARYPRATPAPYANNTENSDFWWVNTSYLRLKTLSLGYTLPKKFTDRLTFKNVRVYLMSQNLLTLSKLKHIDPEMGYDDRETAYPVMKATTFGLDITF